MSLPLTHPLAIVAVLLAIQAAITFSSKLPYARGLFKYVPTMFWIYFLPMVAATLGLLPPEKVTIGGIDKIITPVYGVIGTYFLPASLVLLLLTVDVPAILRLGKVALIVMAAGSLGIMIGGPVVLLLFKPLVPDAIRETIWQGFGSLSASWIGGSANMLAVKEMIKAPAAAFSPMVVVDTICPYAWMCLLIILSRHQRRYDAWNKADDSIISELRVRSLQDAKDSAESARRKHLFNRLAAACMMAAIAVAATFVSLRLGNRLAGMQTVINSKAWTLILSSSIGIALSFTPARRLQDYGASKIGYVLLYFVLASIGATTTLRHLAAAPILIVAGFTWIAIHAVFIIGAARIMRAPMALMAAASQANVGGPASTPVLAEVYLPGLAPVGLLLAVLGNVVGTYLGYACAKLCSMVN